MKKQTILSPFSLALAAGLGLVVTASAAPLDSVVFTTRVFNDDPGSTLATVNNYPTSVQISDTPSGVGGWANLHNFHLADGGVQHSFANNEAITFSADLTISGTGQGEAGLQLAPWWSPNVDGRFNFRTTDGEIAVFGGRLPFYSFTGSQGLHYTKGDTVRVGFNYNPNSLTMGNPATIEYTLTMGANSYTSGALAFDEGNAAEGYGTWGHLDDARVGGYMQILTAQSGDGNNAQILSTVSVVDNNLTAVWGNISTVPEPSTFVLLGLGILPLVFRRRRANPTL